jgi:hypothetical protein
VRELLGLSSLINYILEDLIHRDNGYTEVNSKALGNLILEDVGRTKENDLRLLGPAADKATILVEEAFLQACF